MAEQLEEHPTIGPDHQLPAPPAPPRRRRLRRMIWWGLCLIVLAIGIFLFWRYRENAEKAAAAKARQPPPAITITTVTAQRGNIGVYLDSIGTVTPVYTASITSEVTGLVVAVHFTEGQRVQKGDPLVDIDPRPYRATLLQAQGRWSGTKMSSPKLRWTSTDTVPRGRATALPSKPWTIKRSWYYRTRAPLRTIRERCNTTRFNSTSATSPRPSPAGSVCDWSIRVT